MPLSHLILLFAVGIVSGHLLYIAIAIIYFHYQDKKKD